MTVFTVTRLWIYLQEVHFGLLVSEDHQLSPFECDGDTICGLYWATIFVSIILGFLVIVDAGISPKLGPLEPKAFGSRNRKSSPTVVVVPSVQDQGLAYSIPNPYAMPQSVQMQPQPYYQQSPYSTPPAQLQPAGSYKLEIQGQGYHPQLLAYSQPYSSQGPNVQHQYLY
ncbi:hypothetical protein EMPS_04343 [Entomortierella parvispora]|uniref:Uncharacterized protein n=1 Tax=Entomortierella parvispora TaxID=205924 RepID=A0A9P3H8H0_9FUNG|nr:hypothetical protein EMPS_04343 [Entomortierella parvispora]